VEKPTHGETPPPKRREISPLGVAPARPQGWDFSCRVEPISNKCFYFILTQVFYNFRQHGNCSKFSKYASYTRTSSSAQSSLSLSLSAFSDQHRRTSLILSIYFFFPYYLGWVLMFY